MDPDKRAGGLRAFRWPAIGYTLFVVYGCLVPLRFVWVSWAEAWRLYAPIRTLHPGHLFRTDFAANVVLFAPFAFLWAGVVDARARGAAGWLRSAAVWTAGLLFVLGLEFAQIYVPARSVSLWDVIAGAIGAAVGVVAWWIAADRVRAAVHRWQAARGEVGLARWLLPPYVVFVLLYDLLPLDLTSSPPAILDKWHRGMIRLVPFSGLSGHPLGVAWALASEILLWIPVTGLWTIGRGNPIAGWCLTVILAIGIETAQVLVRSRISDVTDVLCAAAGAAIGVWIGGRVRSR
ncbi:MAG: VanZ family protein [Hyphomicrobiales bacterium]